MKQAGLKAQLSAVQVFSPLACALRWMLLSWKPAFSYCSFFSLWHLC